MEKLLKSLKKFRVHTKFWVTQANEINGNLPVMLGRINIEPSQMQISTSHSVMPATSMPNNNMNGPSNSSTTLTSLDSAVTRTLDKNNSKVGTNVSISNSNSNNSVINRIIIRIRSIKGRPHIVMLKEMNIPSTLMATKVKTSKESRSSDRLRNTSHRAKAINVIQRVTIHSVTSNEGWKRCIRGRRPSMRLEKNFIVRVRSIRDRTTLTQSSANATRWTIIARRCAKKAKLIPSIHHSKTGMQTSEWIQRVLSLFYSSGFACLCGYGWVFSLWRL